MHSTHDIGDAATPVTISDDRLSLALEPGGPTGLDPGAVLRRLEALKIPIDEQLKTRIAALADASGLIHVAQPLVLVQGPAAVEDVPSGLELLVHEKQDAASFYDRSHLMMAQPGLAIARLRPAREGTDGRDVFGRILKHRRAAGSPVKLGQNVALDVDGQTVTATAAGSIHFDGRLLAIETVLELDNVDFSSGNVDFAGAVIIAGTVGDLFHVKGSSVSVGRAVEAAEVHAVNDLSVIGGIIGKDKGHCSAGGNIRAKYITNAQVRAGGHVMVQTEIANCQVTCGGRLVVEHGPLLAGHVIANGGVHVRRLGASSQVSTIVEVGIDATMLATAQPQLADLEKQKRKAERIRALVEPLMRNPKTLSAPQKEKATELLYQADEQDGQVAKAAAQLQAQFEAAQAASKAEVAVAEAVFPGVTIRFPDVETTIRSAIKGPVTIAVRQIDGVERAVAVDGISGSVHSLESHPRHNETQDALRRLLQPPKLCVAA